MKFNPFYLLMFVLLAFSSCGKDDEFSEDDVVGTWKLSGLSCTDGKITDTSSGTATTSTLKITGKDFDADVTFSKLLGIKTFVSSGTYTSVSAITTNGSTITDEFEDDFDDSGSWSLSGKTLKIEGLLNSAYSGEITKLDDNNLVYSAVISEEDDDIKTTGTFVFTFKK